MGKAVRKRSGIKQVNLLGNWSLIPLGTFWAMVWNAHTSESSYPRGQGVSVLAPQFPSDVGWLRGGCEGGVSINSWILLASAGQMI